MANEWTGFIILIVGCSAIGGACAYVNNGILSPEYKQGYSDAMNNVSSAVGDTGWIGGEPLQVDWYKNGYVQGERDKTSTKNKVALNQRMKSKNSTA